MEDEYEPCPVSTSEHEQDGRVVGWSGAQPVYSLFWGPEMVIVIVSLGLGVGEIGKMTSLDFAPQA